MTLRVRRVVTGHDPTGKAVVLMDEECRNAVSRRAKHSSCVIWSTGSFPTDNSTWEDGAARALNSTDPNGTVFRVVRYEPGVAPRHHRTNSMDYAVVLEGEIDLELEGTTVHLKAGDSVVQRGTIHNWTNNGTAPCVIAFVLVAAHPVERGGQILHAMG
jgi:quercetin dioxygenase-like cupin family protein